jgi:PRTRC genetic system ThiF family protein
MVKPLNFDPHWNLDRVIVVGLGGTGACVARAIARVVYDMRRNNLHVPDLAFIDPDTVEENNVGRQMFTAADVGQNKAEVLARRFNICLGLSIEAIPEPVDNKRHFKGYRNHELIVAAVDNHEARRELAKTSTLWLDCGNHRNAGQVVVGNTDKVERITRELENVDDENRITYLPNAALVFPQLLQPGPDAAAAENDLSCAELMARQEQHLLVNDMMANIAAQYAYKLLLGQPVTTFITFVDADGLNMRSVPITPAELRPYLN